MGLPQINSFTLVRLDFLNQESGMALPINCMNRTSLSSNVNWYNILNTISGVGLDMGNALPVASRGQISLFNEAGSFGSEMRISDLLVNHTLQGREVIVYTANVALDSEPSILANLTEVWRARCVGVQWDNEQMRVNIQRTFIAARSMTKVINKVAFPTAPNNSLGKNLPLIFSDTPVQVEATITAEQAAASGSTEKITYAYATTLGNQFVPSGAGADAPRFLFENRITREWQPVTFATDAFTPIYEQDIVPSSGLHIGSVVNLWEQLKDVAYRLQPGQNVTGGEIISGINWYLACSDHASFTGTEEGNYQLTVYDEASGLPGAVITRSVVEFTSSRLQYLGVVNTANIYNFRFFLDNPVMIPADRPIYIGLTRNDKEQLFAPFQDDGPVGGGRVDNFEKFVIEIPLDLTDPNAPKELAASTDFVRKVTNFGLDHFEVFGLAMEQDAGGGSSDYYQEGLGHATATLVQRDQGLVPDLNRLRFVIEAKGLKDDGSGTLTGTANKRLTSCKEVVSCLLKEWNGTTWAGGRFDATAYDNTHDAINSPTGRYYIKIGGASQGRQTTEQILRDVVEQAHGRLIPQSDGTLGLWHWGTELTPAGYLEDELIKFVNAEIGGDSTIVNRVQGIYGRRIINSVEALLADGTGSNYQAAFDSFLDTCDHDYPLTLQSRSFYGLRELGDLQNNWISDADSMANYAALILRLYPDPVATASIQALQRDVTGLQVGDVINVYTVGLPSRYGTSHDARQAVAGTDINTTNLIGGHYYKRQQKYRCLIEGFQLELEQTNNPRVNLALRLIPRSIHT